MKKFLTSLGVFCLATMADAQPGGTGDELDIVGLDDGSGETAYKLTNPSGSRDWFNNDYTGMGLSGRTLAACVVDSVDTVGPGGLLFRVGAYPDSGGGVPTIASAYTELFGAPVTPGDPFNSDTVYYMPCAVIGTDLHIAIQHAPGDSNIWLDSDTNGTIAGRSYFSTTSYSTGAIPYGVNWMLKAGLVPSGATVGTMLANGQVVASGTQTVDNMCLSLYAAQAGAGSALFLAVGGNPLLGPILPIPLTTTGNPITGGPCPNAWTICKALDCNDTTGSFEWLSFYQDHTDTKVNGKPRIKLSTLTTSVILYDLGCNGGGCGGCWGSRDDGILDSTIWKVQNPAASGDWFNMRVGAGFPGVNITGIEISSWDFCGFGPSWAEVGLYQANLTLDPSGGTPLVTTALARVTGTGAAMAPNAADWGYPCTFYNTADVAGDSTTIYHVASRWPAGDSCIWLGSDTDGTDSCCGTPIPNNGGISELTTNDYTTTAVQFSLANWMMKIIWN